MIAKMRYGHALRRFLDHKPAGAPYALDLKHPAVVNGETLFAARVAEPSLGAGSPLRRGAHNRKIGDRVVKGAWSGFPIYTLTLEERATCPPCRHVQDCYGNKMHWPLRWRHGEKLERLLGEELRWLATKWPRGYVVRLHVLGDFYSLEYVRQWIGWLAEIDPLHVYGYTAHPRDSEIGSLLEITSDALWSRFAIRFSNSGHAERATVTLYNDEPSGSAIICPAQTDASECCATCALCWSSRRNIAFLTH